MANQNGVKSEISWDHEYTHWHGNDRRTMGPIEREEERYCDDVDDRLWMENLKEYAMYN